MKQIIEEVISQCKACGAEQFSNSEEIKFFNRVGVKQGKG